MTDEAQPPTRDRAAEQSPEASTGERSEQRDSPYPLGEAQGRTPPVDRVMSADQASRPGPPVSEWARPISDGVGRVPAHPPAPAVAAGPESWSSGGGPAPTYPGTVGPWGGPAGAGGGQPRRVPAPPRESVRAPLRVDAVPGTPFGLVYLDVAPVTSGPAVASLVTGGGSVLAAFAVGCMGLIGLEGGWGGWAAGAFAVLAGLLGMAGVALGELGRRQTGPAGAATWPGGRLRWLSAPAGSAPVRYTGRGLALAGLTCSAVGLGLTVLALALAVLFQTA